MKLSRQQLRRLIMEEAKVAATPYKDAYKKLRDAAKEFGEPKGSVGSEFHDDIGSLLYALAELSPEEDTHVKLVQKIERELDNAAETYNQDADDREDMVTTGPDKHDLFEK